MSAPRPVAVHATLAALLCVAQMTAVAGAQQPAAPPTFSSNHIVYSYGQDYRIPYVSSAAQPLGADVARSTLEFKHFDAWTYGHNFVDLTIKRSSAAEPAAGGGAGALEFYSLFRSGLSINRMAGRPVIAAGPLRDIDIQLGADIQTKNSAFAPNERTLLLGPNFQFKLGSGYLNFAVQLRREWNHNGALGKAERYDTGLNFEPYWNVPIRIGTTRWTLEGYAAFNTPKGRDASGQATHAELIVRPELKLDIGPALGLPEDTLAFSVGYEYWHNMFGKDADLVPGAKQSTARLSLSVHWPSRGAGH